MSFVEYLKSCKIRKLNCDSIRIPRKVVKLAICCLRKIKKSHSSKKGWKIKTRWIKDLLT